MVQTNIVTIGWAAFLGKTRGDNWRDGWADPGGGFGEGERGELVGMVEQPQGQRQGGCKGLSGGHSC